MRKNKLTSRRMGNEGERGKREGDCEHCEGGGCFCFRGASAKRMGVDDAVRTFSFVFSTAFFV